MDTNPSRADRVLIAGGGIAGLATAAALGLRGIHSVVLERRDQALDAGRGIYLPGNAVMALGALGLGDCLERLGAPIGRREYRNRRGRLLFSVDEDAFWAQVEGARDLARGLAGRIRAGDVLHDPKGTDGCPAWCDLWRMCRIRRA